MIEQIVDALKTAGYNVHIGVGASAFKVDVAVVNPKYSSEYILGIICDGKGYYQLKTTRDREVVQPSVLKMLGWNIMHVWSIDWLCNPKAVIDTIIEVINVQVSRLMENKLDTSLSKKNI